MFLIVQSFLALFKEVKNYTQFQLLDSLTKNCRDSNTAFKSSRDSGLSGSPHIMFGARAISPVRKEQTCIRCKNKSITTSSVTNVLS